MDARIRDLADHYIVCGFGYTGEAIVEELNKTKRGFVIIDKDAEKVARLQERGWLVVHGDALQDEVLQQSGIERAKGLCCALDNDPDNMFLTIGAEAGRGVVGEVERVYPAGFTKVSSLGVEQQRVKVIIRFADGVLAPLRAERDLGVDYRVRVRIFTDRRDKALTVPRSAIFRAADSGWQAFVIRNGRAKLQPIDVGLMNDERVEIVKGIEEDEPVILAPESSLEDGDKVTPILRE